MSKINSIFLCGGKGTRMQSETKHKVCFEIDGVPAIVRSMRNLGVPVKGSGILSL